MTDFLAFYLDGGVFNHFVTIGLAIAASSLVFHARSSGEGTARWLRLTDRALLGCVAVGLLGTLMGIIDAGAALQTIPADQFLPAAARGAGIAVVPLAWALLGTIPLGIAATLRGHRASAS